MATNPFEIHIASIIPTSYENAKVGGVCGQHTWSVEEQKRKKFEQAVRYQIKTVAVRWAEVLYCSCKVAHKVHWIPDGVKVKRLKRIQGCHEIVDPPAACLCHVAGADYYFVWIVMSEKVYSQLPKKRQTKAHYGPGKVWVPCLMEREIERLSLKCPRSGIEHEFRRCLVDALHSVGLTNAHINQDEVDERWFVHKVMQLLTPEVLGRLSEKFPYLPGW